MDDLKTFVTFAIVFVMAAYVFNKIFAKPKSKIKIKQLYVYPIKSCKGVTMNAVNISSTGLQYDREWVVVDKDNNFITQRQNPRMALIETEIKEPMLILSAPDMPNQISVPLSADSTGKTIVKVTVFGNSIDAFDCGDDVATWLQKFLGRPDLRLMRYSTAFDRHLDKEFAPKGKTIFADNYSFLMSSIESVREINSKLQPGSTPVTVANFRPNILLEGVQRPFEEDTWSAVTINGKIFNCVRPCAAIVARFQISTSLQVLRTQHIL